MDKKLGQILFVPHGGGPMPLLNDPAHKEMITFMKDISKKLRKPEAIVVISAHWEEKVPTITGSSNPDMLYDYFGFPEEAYNIKYPAPGNPELASEILESFHENGIKAKIDKKRGYDHGVFVPLLLMYPEADIPVIQVSQLRSLDPKQHINLGKALSKLMDKNILVLGSGLAFHNIRSFFNDTVEREKKSEVFNNWLIETITSDKLTEEEREQRLINWENAPGARFSHPREEHLLTVHVLYGIAQANNYKAKTIFNDVVISVKTSGFLWQDRQN